MGIPASRAKAFVAHQQATQEGAPAAAQLKAGAKGAAPAQDPGIPRPRQKDPPRSDDREPPPLPLPGLSEADMQDALPPLFRAHKQVGTAEPPPSLSKLRQRLAKTASPDPLGQQLLARALGAIAVRRRQGALARLAG